LPLNFCISIPPNPGFLILGSYSEGKGLVKALPEMDEMMGMSDLLLLVMVTVARRRGSLPRNGSASLHSAHFF
jgi:hypothetical protein